MINFLLDSLWVFFIVFVIPIILFVGLYRIGKFLINLINKKFHKQFSSSWAYLLLIPLPLYFVLFFAGGCSFKYIDPQYYEFKRLCYLNAGKIIVGDKVSENFIYGNFWISKQITSKITDNGFEIKDDNNKTIFYKNNTYFYDNYGIFLKGDEGAGWHWENKELLDCEDIDKKFTSIMSLRKKD